MRLVRRVLGADDAPFGPVMGKRGEAGAAAGMGATGVDSSSGGTTTVAASASETPRRWARAERERAGASPRARSAASNTGNRTWIGFVANFAQEVMQGQLPLAVEGIRQPGSRIIRPQ